MVVAAILSPHPVDAQVPWPSDDPLRHGHALLIGNSHYRDPSWTPLDDIPLQLAQLEKGLKDHFDTVQVVQDLEAIALLGRINDFVREYGNDANARLFIYYAGHGYTEIQRNENRGYITGIDTPRIDGTQRAYDAARLKAVSMAEIRAPLERAPAKSILFLFDSCFAGTIFTNRAGNDAPRPLTRDTVTHLMERPARDIITAGRQDQRVPAHSPIPDLFLAALNGAADPYKHGVISSSEIHAYLLNRVLQMHDIKLTPSWGRLPNPDFAEGTFLFRISNLAVGAEPPQADDNEWQTRERYAALMSRGDTKVSNGDFDRAIVDYSEAMRLNPTNAVAFYGRGSAYSFKGEYDRAIADFSEAIRLDPKYTDALYNRGVMYGAKGEYDRAIADYSEEIRLDPKYTWALYNRGVMYWRKGEYDRAIADLNEAIRLYPQSAVGFCYRAQVKQAKGDRTGARADFNRANKLSPSSCR